MAHGYYVALFDILGFEQRLKRYGLDGMLARYQVLVDAVNYRKKQIARVFDDYGLSEAPYWTAEGDVMTFTKIRGAYASDSILLWGHRTWPKARGKSLQECADLSSDQVNGWAYQPTPCDNFLEVCNDLMCRSIEAGLPLRGAIAIGQAILDHENNIFFGQPIVDAARLESGQKMISTSLCKSALSEQMPQRFVMHFGQHTKESHVSRHSGLVLDWPRHWRQTRTNDLVNTLKKLDIEPQFSCYYQNTLDLIEFSERFAGKFESPMESSIRTAYPQFSWENNKLEVSTFFVRRVPIADA